MTRAEAYLNNLLWILGASQAIICIAGDGPLAWVCLTFRILCVLIFKNDTHKETVMNHLIAKTRKAMDDPHQRRFYKTNAALGLPEESAPVSKPKPKPKGAPKASPGTEEGADASSGASSASSSQKNEA